MGSPQGHYPQQPPRIVYYRGADGRLYGVAVPAALGGPPTTRLVPRSDSQSALSPVNPPYSRSVAPPRAARSGVVIEDVAEVDTVMKPAAPSQSEGSAISEVESTVVESSARLQAEAALLRFQRFQGMEKESRADVVTQPGVVAKARESLPPPKAY